MAYWTFARRKRFWWSVVTTDANNRYFRKNYFAIGKTMASRRAHRFVQQIQSRNPAGAS